MDWNHMLQYFLEERKNSAEPTTAVVLANDVVLCGCEDFVIRAFTMKGVYRTATEKIVAVRISISGLSPKPTIFTICYQVIKTSIHQLE
jgi:hypothetical protein